jgi:hypothetical protein
MIDQGRIGAKKPLRQRKAAIAPAGDFFFKIYSFLIQELIANLKYTKLYK